MRVFLPNFSLLAKEPQIRLSSRTNKKPNKATAFNYKKFNTIDNAYESNYSKPSKFIPEKMIMKHKSLMLENTISCRTLSVEKKKSKSNKIEDKLFQVPIHSRVSSCKSRKVSKTNRNHSFEDNQSFMFSSGLDISNLNTKNVLKGTKKTINESIKGRKIDTNHLLSSHRIRQKRLIHQFTMNTRRESQDYRPWSPNKIYDDYEDPQKE